METLSFEELEPLMGQKIDAPVMVDFLQRHPDHRITKPSDGAQYVIFRSLGFDLLFQKPRGRADGTTRRERVLICIFLFREGEERHRQFACLPFGIVFSDHRDTLEEKLGPSYESSVTRGLGALGWEKWRIGEWTLHAMYDRNTLTTRTFTLGCAVLEEVSPSS